MRKEVRLKPVSAFIFFAGVLFGYNDAYTPAQYLRFQERKTPSYGEHQFHSNAIISGAPPYSAHNSVPSTADDGVHSFGEVNGAPYFIRVTTVPLDSTDNSGPSFSVQVPSRARNSDDALRHAETPQSPILARNPAVIFVTVNPTPPCGTGKPVEVSAAGGFVNFRKEDKSVPSEGSDQPRPRFLLRHLFPSTPKEKRVHYSRNPRSDKRRSQPKKRFPFVAKLFKFFHFLHHAQKDASLSWGSNVPNKTKPPPTPKEKETEYSRPAPPPTVVTPPEDNKQSQPNTYGQPYPEAPALPYSPEAPPAPPYPHNTPPPSFPEENPPSYIHYPSQPFFPEEQQPPSYPQYSPPPFYPEEPQPPLFPQFPPPPFYPEDPQAPPFPQFPPMPFFPEEPQPPPYSPYSPPPYYPEEQPSYLQYAPPPFYPEEPQGLSYRESPPQPEPSEKQEQEDLDLRHYSSSPSYSDEGENRFVSQYPPSPFVPDELGYSPFALPPSWPFFTEELGPPPYSRFPPWPLFPEELGPSPPPPPPFSRFPLWPFFSEELPSSNRNPPSVFITSSRPSPFAKSLAFGDYAAPKADYLFVKTFPSDWEDYALADESNLPCSANKKYLRLFRKEKASKEGWGKGGNSFILLKDEDDSLPEDDTDDKTTHPLLIIIENLLKNVFQKFMSCSDD